MKATPSQGHSPPPPNSHSLPALSDRIQNLQSRLRAFTARPYTGTEYTFSILPSRPLSGTATTTPCSLYFWLTATFLLIIRQKTPPTKTVTALITTTREEMAEDNRREGGGLTGWGIWGGQRSLSDAVNRTCTLGLLPIVQRGGVEYVEGGYQSYGQALRSRPGDDGTAKTAPAPKWPSRRWRGITVTAFRWPPRIEPST